MPRPLLALAGLVSLVMAACAGAPVPATPQDAASTATATPVPTEEPARPPAGVPLPTPPSGLVPAQVVRVVDGDTIHVQIAGREYTVRYIGIDTPETVAPGRPVECYGPEASRRNRELVQGRQVMLEKDVSETDRFGRLLRYVWVDGQMVNALMVAEGYASAATFPPDVKYAELFVRLEAEARANNRGLWGACPAGDS